MAESARISVDARLLRWARETAGLSASSLAARLGVKPRILRAWETLGGRPTVRQLERLADATKRPLAALFLAEPPQEPELPDFRLPSADQPAPKTSATLFAIRRARRLQRVFGELVGAEDRDASRQLAVAEDDTPDSVATEARRLLGVTFDVQAGWSDARRALREWRTRLESLDVLVFQFAMPPDEISGFSLADGSPAVVLNRKDVDARRIFTLFHEWAHLLRGQPGLCLVDESGTRNNSPEVFCNAFAGSVLVPMTFLQACRPFVAYSEQQISLADAVRESTKLFSVSRYVLLRRFLTAKVISVATYRDTVARWDRERRPRRKAKGGAPPHVVRLSELGGRFVSGVLGARERGLITYSDAADYLSLRVGQVERVQELVGFPAR